MNRLRAEMFIETVLTATNLGVLTWEAEDEDGGSYGDNITHAWFDNYELFLEDWNNGPSGFQVDVYRSGMVLALVWRTADKEYGLDWMEEQGEERLFLGKLQTYLEDACEQKIKREIK